MTMKTLDDYFHQPEEISTSPIPGLCSLVGLGAFIGILILLI